VIRGSAETLARRRDARPVIVVVALEGKEFGSVQAAHVLDAVRRSGALVHVLRVDKPSLETMTGLNQWPTEGFHQSIDETLARNTVLAEAPRHPAAGWSSSARLPASRNGSQRSVTSCAISWQ
jgi:hypothetical protein